MSAQIEKFHWKTEEAFNCIRNGKPVVLKECPIAYPAYSNWTFENIADMIRADFPCDVFISKSKTFPSWDLSRNLYQYDFTPPTEKVTMTFREFLLKLHSQDTDVPNNQEFHFLHQTLVAEMGPKILEEYTKFSLQTASLYKVLAGWNELTHNLLYCGKEGYTTPLRYDLQENIFTQLYGRKRVRLFSPNWWHALYPYPTGHPCDRQSQLTLPSEPGCSVLDNEEDRFRFPAFGNAFNDEGMTEFYTDLEPGEVLYIPQYWFHQTEGLTESISLSWWFKHTNKKDIDYKNIRLDDVSLSAVRRNIEGAMAHMVGYGKKAQQMFLSIASGHTKIPKMSYRTAPSSSSSKREKDDKLSTENSGIDLLIVDSDAGALKLKDIDENIWKPVVERALSMLQTLFKAEHTARFLLQVVMGRFNTF